MWYNIIVQKIRKDFLKVMLTKQNLLNWISENSTIIDNEEDFMERLSFEMKHHHYLPSFSKQITKLIDDYNDGEDWEDIKEALIDLLFD